MASWLTGDHFTSGKGMSLLGAGLVGMLAFQLLRRLFGSAPALLAVPITLVSGEFTAYSIQATTDIPFLVVIALVLWILITSSARAVSGVRAIVERQPVELVAAGRFLARVAPSDATVMARKPNVAHLSRRRWRELLDAGSLEELRAILEPTPPHYLIYDRIGYRFIPALRMLANPETRVRWLESIYTDPPWGITIYAISLRHADPSGVRERGIEREPDRE